MAPAPFRVVSTGALLLGLAGPLAATPPAPANIESSQGQFVFSLLPKSFQKNPLVDETVITEMTDEGKKLPLPSSAQPAYFVAQSGGLKRIAGDDPMGDHPPTAEDIEPVIQRALAVNGYMPAAAGHPPSLLLIYHWGLHSNLDEGSSEIEGTATPDIGHSVLLSRAALVGGTKFAADLKRALKEEDDSAAAAAYVNVGVRFNAVAAFLARGAKSRQLYEQAQVPCYYVIVSAYDYAAAAHGAHTLLWRSKLTVDAAGVSMADTLPTLIANAGPYFGRDMPEAATMTKPVNREGHTKLGPMQVEEYMEKPAPEHKP